MVEEMTVREYAIARGISTQAVFKRLKEKKKLICVVYAKKLKSGWTLQVDTVELEKTLVANRK